MGEEFAVAAGTEPERLAPRGPTSLYVAGNASKSVGSASLLPPSLTRARVPARARRVDEGWLPGPCSPPVPFGYAVVCARLVGRHYDEAVTRTELHELVDELPDDAVEGAGLVLARLVRGEVDPDQAWVWTPEWQDQLRSSLAELSAGRTERFSSDKEFFTSL